MLVKTKSTTSHVNDDTRVRPLLDKLNGIRDEIKAAEINLQHIEQVNRGLKLPEAKYAERAAELLAGKLPTMPLVDSREWREENDRLQVLLAARNQLAGLVRDAVATVANEIADDAKHTIADLNNAVVESLERLVDDLNAEAAFRQELQGRGVGTGGICSPRVAMLNRMIEPGLLRQVRAAV